jgi:AbrB family looped-hinge helix DNA binding protein
MPKVTSKYQVTVPKAIADKYHIQPGDQIDWEPAGEVIRVVPAGKQALSQRPESRLRLFDQATERHRKRSSSGAPKPGKDRGWTREDLYGRGRSR